MAQDHLKRAKAGIVILTLIGILAILSLPSMGDGHNFNTWCWAGPEGAEAHASVTDQDEGGVGAYAYAEANHLIAGFRTQGDGPYDDDAVVTAHAKILSYPGDIALESFSEYWAEAEGHSAEEADDCTFNWLEFSGEDLPSSVQDDITAVSCVLDSNTTDYAYSGKVYHDTDLGATFLWQGSDGVNLTAHPELNSNTPTITSMTSQATRVGLTIDAYGSSSWGCKMEFS